MNMRNNRHRHSALVIFGVDFENFGGIRSLAIADGMNADDPVECLDYNMDNLIIRLGDLALEGYQDAYELQPFVGATSPRFQ